MYNYIIVYGSGVNFIPVFVSKNSESLDRLIDLININYSPEYIIAKETILDYNSIIEDYNNYITGMLKCLHD